MGNRGRGYFSTTALVVCGITVGIVIVLLYQYSFSIEPASQMGAESDSLQVVTESASERRGSGDRSGDKGAEVIDQGGRIIFSNMELDSAEWLVMQGGGPGGLPNRCTNKVDNDASAGEETFLTVSCEHAEASFGGIYKQFSGAPFVGREIRFSGDLRSTNLGAVGSVEGVGSLWVRIGIPGASPVINNGLDVGITGTSGWENRHIDMYVPEGVGAIMIGYWAQGVGQLSVRNLNLTYLN